MRIRCSWWRAATCRCCRNCSATVISQRSCRSSTAAKCCHCWWAEFLSLSTKTLNSTVSSSYSTSSPSISTNNAYMTALSSAPPPLRSHLFSSTISFLKLMACSWEPTIRLSLPWLSNCSFSCLESIPTSWGSSMNSIKSKSS